MSWHVLLLVVRDLRARNGDRDLEEIQAVLDEAVREVRANRRARGAAQNV